MGSTSSCCDNTEQRAVWCKNEINLQRVVPKLSTIIESETYVGSDHLREKYLLTKESCQPLIEFQSDGEESKRNRGSFVTTETKTSPTELEKRMKEIEDTTKEIMKDVKLKSLEDLNPRFRFPTS